MSMLANIIKLVNVFAHTKAISKMLAITFHFKCQKILSNSYHKHVKNEGM